MYSKTLDSKDNVQTVPFVEFENDIVEQTKRNENRNRDNQPIHSLMVSQIVIPGKHYQVYTSSSKQTNTDEINPNSLLVMKVNSDESSLKSDVTKNMSGSKMRIVIQTNFRISLDYAFIEAVVVTKTKQNSYFENVYPEVKNFAIDHVSDSERTYTDSINDQSDNESMNEQEMTTSNIDMSIFDSDSENDESDQGNQMDVQSEEENEELEYDENDEDTKKFFEDGYRKTLFVASKPISVFNDISEEFNSDFTETHIFNGFKILKINQSIFESVNDKNRAKRYKTIIELDMNTLFNKFFSNSKEDNMLLKLFINNVLCKKELFHVSENDEESKKIVTDIIQTNAHRHVVLDNDKVKYSLKERDRQLLNEDVKVFKSQYYHFCPVFNLIPCPIVLLNDQDYENRNTFEMVKKFQRNGKIMERIFKKY